MAYMIPVTDIYVLKGVPLDNSYQDTLYFENTTETEHSGFFLQHFEYVRFSKQSYQRTGRNTIRVESMIGDLEGFNYLMFKNETWSNKWYYAFVTHAEYVNNITTELTYEIDVMQTWLPTTDYEVMPCFVKREMAETDEIGEHVLAEDIGVGDVHCAEQTNTGFFSDYSICLATGYDPDDRTPGGIYGGLPSGLVYYNFGSFHDNEKVNAFIEYLQDAVENEKDDAIVCIWLQPSGFAELSEGVYDAMDSGNVQRYTVSLPTDISGYVPKNNKLFCYPYNYLCVDNSEGEQATYRYEWFGAYGLPAINPNFTFTLSATVAPNPEVLLIPYDYNVGGFANDEGLRSGSTTESLTMSNFGQIAWASDAYKAWVAQGGVWKTVFTAGDYAVSGFTGSTISHKYKNNAGAVGGLIGGALGAANTIYSAVKEANKGATGHGSQTGDAGLAYTVKDFYFRRMQVQYEYAQAIDDYFTKYGYMTCRLKVPNMNVRPHWNYVETVGCKIKSNNVPADDTAQIEQIFDNGITFWVDADEVGDYTLDNSPA